MLKTVHALSRIKRQPAAYGFVYGASLAGQHMREGLVGQNLEAIDRFER